MEEFLIDGYVVDNGTIWKTSTGEMIPDAPFTVLDLSVRPFNVIMREGAKFKDASHETAYISDILCLSDDQLMKLRNLGMKSYMEIKEKLALYLGNAEAFAHIESNRPNSVDSENTEEVRGKTPITPENVEAYLYQAGFSGATTDEIRLAYAGKDTAQLETVLEQIEEENRIEFENGYWKYLYPSFFDYAAGMFENGKNRQAERGLEIFRMRSSGATLEIAGKQYGLSRERIRQIEQKMFRVLLNKKQTFREDLYGYLYQTYYIPKEILEDTLHLDEKTKYYLTVRYDKGKKDISEALEDPEIPEEIKEAITSNLLKDTIEVDGIKIPMTRPDIEDYLIKTYCKDEKTYNEFREIYYHFINENGLSGKKFTSEDGDQDASRQNRFAMAPNILWKQNQRLRYYDMNRDFDDLLQALNLSQYHDTELSARRLLLDNPELMSKYDIRDEYELHNLLKKIHAEKENPSLEFRRMPILRFGTFDRKQAMKDLIYANSPISADDLIRKIAHKYGPSVNTIKANWLNEMTEFYHRGMYIRPEEKDEQKEMNPNRIMHPRKNENQNEEGNIAHKEQLSLQEKLYKRIKTEFYQKTLIGDIQISDDEYDILKQYFRNQCRFLQEQTELFECDEMICVLLVQIGIRNYIDGTYWPFVQEIVPSLSNRDYEWIGNSFLGFMRNKGKILITEKKVLASILLHGFVSDRKAPELFDFLFMFYSIDLHCDMQRMKEDETFFEGLIDNIKSGDDKGRTYKLLEHTCDAVRCNEQESRARLRYFLELIDKARWEQAKLPTESDNRLIRHFIVWSKNSPAMNAERNKGSKYTNGYGRIWNPYLKYDYKKDEFKIVLPECLIHNVPEANAMWLVEYADISRNVNIDAFQAATGYMTEEKSIILEKEHLFDTVILTLIYDGIARKETLIEGDSIRFFELNGNYAKTTSLKEGEMISFSKTDYIPESEARRKVIIANGMAECHYEFENGDLIIFPGRMMLCIGSKMTEGLQTKGIQKSVYAVINGCKYDVFSTMPSVLARIQDEDCNGTLLIVNDKRYRLFEENQPKQGVNYFELQEMTQKNGMQIVLEKFCGNENGKYHVELDIPNDQTKRTWDFMLINGLKPYFDESPYIFQDHGVLCVPEETALEALDPCKDIETEEGQKRFAFDIPADTEDFHLQYNGIPIAFTIPKFSYRFAGEERWQTKQHLPIWYTDLPSYIEIRYPGNLITFSLDQTGETVGDESEFTESVHSKSYSYSKEKGYFYCELINFKDWLGKRVAVRKLFVQVPEMEEALEFLTIYTKSIFISAMLIPDYADGTIHGQFDIQGKANYVADLYYGEEKILDHESIIDGKLLAKTESLTGTYRVDVFEVTEDDSGFDDPEYIFLGTKKAEFVDPTNLTGKHIEIIQPEIIGEETYLQLKRHYVLYDIEPITNKEKGHYRGHMIVTNSSGEYREDYPAAIFIPDLNELSKAILYMPDEYGDMEFFVYDNDRYIMCQREDPSVPRVFRYRRFVYLDDYDYYFRIRFVEKPDNLENWLASERYMQQMRSVSKGAEQKYKAAQLNEDPLNRKVSLLGLSIHTCNALMRSGINTTTELFNYIMHGTKLIQDIKRRDFEECITQLRKVGYDIPEF